MFYLSGAINVLLFLIARPEVLLFPRPNDFRVTDLEQESLREIAPQRTGPEIISDTARFQHSPEPTSAALGDGVPRDIATPSRVSSRISI